MRTLIEKITRRVVNRILSEAEFKKGDYFIFPGSTSAAANYVKRLGLTLDDFDYDGNDRYTFKGKKAKRVAKPKNQGKRKDETEEQYLERVRSTNNKFAQAEQEIEGEEWRPVINSGRFFGGDTNYEKSYEVSNMGRMRIIDFSNPKKCRISDGYDAPVKKARNFHLDVPDRKTTPPIHTIVADTWLPRPEGDINKYYVKHLDGNYHNNRVDNLKYVPRGEARKKNGKLDDPEEYDYEFGEISDSIKRAVRESIKKNIK